MQIRTVIFATGNPGKMREVREILSDLDARVMSMREAEAFCEPEETGTTFEENALIKARAVAEKARGLWPGLLVLADDSGLEVDYLHKKPGVYSARWMGEDTSYRLKNAAIVGLLEGVPDEERTARFVSAIAAVFPDGTEAVVREAVEGIIGYEERGDNGFGYDPIFYLPELGKTSAEIPMEEKNKISHRGKALRRMEEVIRAYENRHRQ